MLDSLEIRTRGPLSGVVRPPGSKSLTNRALVCAALATGRSTLSGVLDSVDTRVMVDSLERLGIAVTCDWDSARLSLQGCSGRIPSSQADLFVANSGTSARFLAGMVSLGHGIYRIDGNERMRERPIRDLLEGLVQLGVQAQSVSGSGCPPIEVCCQGIPGGKAKVRGDVSSQFLSGLLLAAPYANQPVELEVEGTLVSPPYVWMTLAVMEAFGLKSSVERSPAGWPRRFAVPQGGYQGRDYAIEPDASAASYFFAAAAISGGSITVAGLSRASLQGDIEFVSLLERMGCRAEWGVDSVTVHGAPLVGIDVDMNAISDTVMTLAAVALFAKGPTTITNVGHIRHKETDRIHALAVELRKLGAEVDEHSEGLRITPGNHRGAAIDTYDDHRMAMGLALAGLRIPHVVINDPGCTAKTYPHFFRDLESLSG